MSIDHIDDVRNRSIPRPCGGEVELGNICQFHAAPWIPEKRRKLQEEREYLRPALWKHLSCLESPWSKAEALGGIRGATGVKNILCRLLQTRNWPWKYRHCVAE